LKQKRVKQHGKLNDLKSRSPESEDSSQKRKKLEWLRKGLQVERNRLHVSPLPSGACPARKRVRLRGSFKKFEFI